MASLSMEWADRLRTVGVIALVAGAAAAYWFDPFGLQDRQPQEAGESFDCALRRMMVIELEAIHKQRVVASLEHNGILLELRENPDHGGFSLLWTRQTEMEIAKAASCIIVSGKDWTSPPDGDPFLVEIDYDPFPPTGREIK